MQNNDADDDDNDYGNDDACKDIWIYYIFFLSQIVELNYHFAYSSVNVDTFFSALNLFTLLLLFVFIDYIFDGQSSIDESLSRAVIDNERKIGEHQIKTMVQLTVDLVLAMLKNVVVGEKPLTFSAPSGLSLTIEM